MTGPEHYREAAQLLALANNAEQKDAALLIATAAVHAQLAAVAVAALAARPAHEPGGLPDVDYEAWDAAAGVQLADPDEDQD